MALALGEDRDQHVGAGHLLAARRLHMDHRALDHALEAGGRLGIVGAVGDQILEFGVEIVDEAACAACRDRRCRRASRRPHPDRRSAPAADAPASRIRDDARWRSPAHDAGIVQGSGKKLAFASSVAPCHHDRRCPVRQQQPLSYSYARSWRKAGSARVDFTPKSRDPSARSPYRQTARRSVHPVQCKTRSHFRVGASRDVTSFPSRIAGDAGACAQNPSPASPWSRRFRR